ncbi:MAG: hypothetical protein HFJ45_01030 [Clostridia bacterium]|nr:hypothetical protein [Clostridia bacterium]
MTNKKIKIKKFVSSISTMLFLMSTNVFATGEKTATIGTKEVTTATENLQRVITSIAIPLGSIIIFASLVITAIKMISNSNNPGKRSETIGSLAWITAGGVLLGLSIVVTGIILNVATNGTGQLIN